MVRIKTGTHMPTDLVNDTPASALAQKCQHCHLFIEKNDRSGEGIAQYVHLTRADADDELIGASHAAAPSGQIATLSVWQEFGPTAMRERFADSPAQRNATVVARLIADFPNADDELDDIVHDYASHIGTDVNNSGAAAQMLWLLEQGETEAGIRAEFT